MIRVLVLGALGAGLVFTRGNTAPADWFEPTATEAIAGFAARYDPGLMATVLLNRGLELASYHRGAVALMRRGDLGREVWIRFLVAGPELIRGRPEWFGPYLVADCSNRRNYEALLEIDRAIELSAQEWRSLGLPEAPVAVIVSFADPWPREVGPWFE